MAGALDALRAEAEGTSLSVCGWKVNLDWSYDTIHLVASGRYVAFYRIILGAQWDKFKKTHNNKKKLEAFLEELWKAAGVKWDDMREVISVLDNDEYCRALEADLLPYCDLRDLFTGDLNMRRLAVLYEGLGDDSRIYKALAGVEAKWDRKEYMMADIADMLNYQTVLLHVLAQIQGLKKPIKAPKPVYVRPGTEKVKKKISPTSDLSWLLGKANGRG